MIHHHVTLGMGGTRYGSQPCQSTHRWYDLFVCTVPSSSQLHLEPIWSQFMYIFPQDKNNTAQHAKQDKARYYINNVHWYG